MKPEVGPEQEALLARLINTGATLQNVLMVFSQYRSHEVRARYAAMKRPYTRLRPVVEPEEIALRQRWVQEQWEPQDWGRRWVGRYATTRDTDLQQAASKMLS